MVSMYNYLYVYIYIYIHIYVYYYFTLVLSSLKRLKHKYAIIQLFHAYLHPGITTVGLIYKVIVQYGWICFIMIESVLIYSNMF